MHWFADDPTTQALPCLHSALVLVNATAKPQSTHCARASQLPYIKTMLDQADIQVALSLNPVMPALCASLLYGNAACEERLTKLMYGRHLEAWQQSGSILLCTCGNTPGPGRRCTSLSPLFAHHRQLFQCLRLTHGDTHVVHLMCRYATGTAIFAMGRAPGAPEAAALAAHHEGPQRHTSSEQLLPVLRRHFCRGSTRAVAADRCGW